MNWGDSQEQLKDTYPEIQWEKEKLPNIIVYSVNDSIAGIQAKTSYYFIDDKLEMGSYSFLEDHKYNNIYYDDFLLISSLLNKNYEMERKDRWNNAEFKDDRSRIGYALLKGDVVIEERFEGSRTLIIHTLLGDKEIKHGLVYASQDYVNDLKAKNRNE